MKILLTAINAKYIHSNLAVYSLRAYAKEYEEQIQIMEYTINNRVEEILEGIYKAHADVICFSCYIWNFSYVEELITELKKICPDTPIWVGGPEVSYEVEDLLRNHSQIDGVIIGEGEHTFYEMCRCYVEKAEADREEEFLKMSGIAYRKADGEVRITEPAKPIDMSTIPFCYESMGDFKNRIIYYESSRGCPFSCSYCLSSVDKRLRFRSLDLVKKELEFFIEQEVPQVKFVDRTFNCNHEHAMEIWRFIKEKDKGITNFHFEVSADLLNEEEIAFLATMRPGLVQLEIGVQSTNGITIQEIHRTMNLEKLKEVVQKIEEANNIHQHLDLIAGLPYEDYETFGKSFDEIYALKPQQLQLGFLKVLKGSYMFEHAKEYGMIYQSKPPYEIMATNWLTFDEVLKIKQVEEMLEVYYNSGQFEVTMKVIEPLFESSFRMFQKLGEFYEKRGYFQMKHTRIRRCEILLEFMEEYQMPDIEMLKQALTYDLYYRENMKTRPAFSMNLEPYKKIKRQVCGKGKMSHLEPFTYRFPAVTERTITKLPKPCELYFVLFDYEKRDALTNQAAVTTYAKEELDDKENR
ncbi:MAG: B12-binding domain-containing radical SAM protein [Lachnospiraceae bacterium]